MSRGILMEDHQKFLNSHSIDNLQPLTGGVEQQLDAVVAELDGEIVGQGLLITVRNLHSYC